MIYPPTPIKREGPDCTMNISALSFEDRKARQFLLVIIAVVAVCAAFFINPVAQDPQYHRFADTETIAGVANFWNVVSNIPFLLVGAFALWRAPTVCAGNWRIVYIVLGAGVTLVGFGSAYYHHAPSNQSLLWDRLPMTVAFMALLWLIIADRVVAGLAQSWLWLLVGLGIGSVLYWSWTQAHGMGDLRPYAVVQFLPLLLIPLVLGVFPCGSLDRKLILWAFAWYLLAKALEHYDLDMMHATGWIGGHPLKHLAAAIAVLCLVRSVPSSGPIQHPQSC